MIKTVVIVLSSVPVYVLDLGVQIATARQVALRQKTCWGRRRPETLAILEIAFNEAWGVLVASGGDFDQKATRDAGIHQLVRRLEPTSPKTEPQERVACALSLDGCSTARTSRRGGRPVT